MAPTCIHFLLLVLLKKYEIHFFLESYFKYQKCTTGDTLKGVALVCVTFALTRETSGLVSVTFTAV